MKARETNNGKKGGLLKGKSHEKGGIKVVVTDTNQMVEVEGGEAIITKPAVKKNWKLLSKINQEAGGNPILPPSKAVLDTDSMAKGGALEPHKEVSASIQASIKDVLSMPQFNDLKPMEAGMLYSMLSDYKDFEKTEEGMPTQELYLSEMQESIIDSLFEKEYLIDDRQLKQYGKYIITLTEKATEFIDAVTTRLQTRRAVKQGTDLFPDESAIPELVPVEYPEEAVSKSKSDKPVKYSAREINDVKPIDLMRNLALLKPELKDLMDEAIVVTEKLNEIGIKSDYNAFDFEYHSTKPNAKWSLFPFVHRMYMQFVTSRKSTPEKKEKDIERFTRTIENAKEYLKNPPSDEELAQLKKEKEQSELDKIKKIEATLLSGKLQAERIAEIEKTEKEFIESIGVYPRSIASLLERGVSKQDILLTHKIAQAFEEIDGVYEFQKIAQYMEKWDFNINALISKFASVNYEDKEKRQKSIDLILKLEKIASGDADAVEQKKFSENYRPLLWHLTLKEFCEYAENYEVDTRLEGTKARLECEEFYKYAVVRPLLDDSAERNVFLLAVESGQLPYEKAVEIITSAGAWNESNKFIKELEENNRRRIYYANIWHTPKELYLSSDYFKNNFTKAKANKHYAKQIYYLAILNDKQTHELLEQGIISFKDIQARINESGANITSADQRYIDKLKAIAVGFLSKLKMKGLYLLLDDKLEIKKEKKGVAEYEIGDSVVVELSDSVGQKTRYNGRITDVDESDNTYFVESSTNISQWVSEDLILGIDFKDAKDGTKRLPQNEEKFVDILVGNNHKLIFGSTGAPAVKYSKPTLEKLARENGIKEQNLAKELAELSIYKSGRAIARQVHNYTRGAKYRDIVKLYESQVNLSHRTSESIMFQQYSTPAPIGFVAGTYCGIDENSGGEYFEASAGNGLLTIAGNPKNWIVNEIDNIRNRNLNSIGFKQVLKQDATEPFKNFAKKFDAIITNPPFARIEGVEYGNVKLTSLEQLMSLRALETMKDDGKGAIIIGGHTEYDKEGRIQAGKNRIFFVYLYKHYNVEDVINISGRDLYSRQGTSFNTRLILINGRKKVPSGFPPIITEPIPMDKTNSYTPVNSFEVLWERVNKLL